MLSGRVLKVIGCLLAGFYLLRVYDVAFATYVAVALNVGVATVAFLIATMSPVESAAPAAPAFIMVSGRTVVYVVIALSGLTALSSEVLWTRTLSLLIGATTYTFSLILAVFLFGIGLGSSVGAALARTLERPRVALAWAQLSLCAAMAWTSYILTESLPYWPVNPYASTLSEVDVIPTSLMGDHQL